MSRHIITKFRDFELGDQIVNFGTTEVAVSRLEETEEEWRDRLEGVRKKTERIRRVGDIVLNTLIGVAVAAITVSLLSGVAAIREQLANTESWMSLPACTVEDSSKVYPCLWDASERGNREGRSFIMLGE